MKITLSTNNHYCKTNHNKAQPNNPSFASKEILVTEELIADVLKQKYLNGAKRELVESGKINLELLGNKIWEEIQRTGKVLDADNRVHGVISLGSYQLEKTNKQIIKVDITPGEKYIPPQPGSSFYGYTFAHIDRNGLNLAEKVANWRDKILGISRQTKPSKNELLN